MKEWRYKKRKEGGDTWLCVDDEKKEFPRRQAIASIWQHPSEGYAVYTIGKNSKEWEFRTTLSNIGAAKVAAMLFC